MRIGGFEKQSLVDWSGKISAVIFTKGCNFRCGYCHNPSLVLPQHLELTADISESIIFEYLRKRKNWLDGVVVTGGEPTIQHDLHVFLKEIKNIGYAIKLDTNGYNPQKLKFLIQERLVDFVAMDIKTCLDIGSYNKIIGITNSYIIKNITKSIEILRSSNISYQFRTTILPNHHSDEIISHLRTIFKNEEYVCQNFQNVDIIEKY